MLYTELREDETFFNNINPNELARFLNDFKNRTLYYKMRDNKTVLSWGKYQKMKKAKEDLLLFKQPKHPKN